MSCGSTKENSSSSYDISYTDRLATTPTIGGCSAAQRGWHCQEGPTMWTHERETPDESLGRLTAEAWEERLGEVQAALRGREPVAATVSA